MESGTLVFREPDGLQRVQWVRWENWEDLTFLRPAGSPKALDCFAGIYRQYLVPACPWLFGKLVLFRACDPGADALTEAAAVLRREVRLGPGGPRFRTERAKVLWHSLEKGDHLRVVRGKLPFKKIIPVGDCGFLTESGDAPLKFNASFFIMDPFDCATVYDHVGTPLGLLVKDGIVENPPLYGREALLVRGDGSVSVEPVALRQQELEIAGARWRIGENARAWTRPQRARIRCRGRKCLVIVGCRVVAVKSRGMLPVPASGFVLCPRGECGAKVGDTVTYRGMEDVRFGIQVGNSILRGGVPTEKFISGFYNIRRMEPVPYPPSLYPMDFQKGRAARMALGADAEGRPMVLWAEGAPKAGFDPRKHSRGAALADMPRYCQAAGMVHAVNLDGGGSAQLLLEDRRTLDLSDRTPDGKAEAERPIPLGLQVLK